MCPYSNRRARPQLSPSIPGLHCIGRYWACLKELGLCDKADADLIEKKLKVPKIQVTKQHAIRVWRSQAPLARCSLHTKAASHQNELVHPGWAAGLRLPRVCQSTCALGLPGAGAQAARDSGAEPSGALPSRRAPTRDSRSRLRDVMVRLCWFADSHSQRLGGAEGEKLRAYRLWVKKRLDKAHKDVPPTPHPVLNPLEPCLTSRVRACTYCRRQRRRHAHSSAWVARMMHSSDSLPRTAAMAC